MSLMQVYVPHSHENHARGVRVVSVLCKGSDVAMLMQADIERTTAALTKNLSPFTLKLWGGLGAVPLEKQFRLRQLGLVCAGLKNN